jgi:predicted Zn-dependent protease
MVCRGFGAFCLAWLAACGAASTPSTSLISAPATMTSHYLLGALARQENNDADAAVAFATASEADSSPYSALEHARALQRSGNSAAGLAIAQAATEKFPGSSDAWIALAELLLASMQPEAAQTAFQNARRLAPLDQRGYLLAAQALPDNAQRLALVRQFLARVPRSLDGNMALAEYLHQNPTEATAEQLGALHVALEVEPNQLDARLALATALLGHNDERAVAEVRSAFARSGDQLDIGLILLRTLGHLDRRHDASDVVHVMIDDRSPNELTTLALAAVDIGLFEDAQRIAETLAPASPQLARLVEATIALRRGDVATCIAKAAPLLAHDDSKDAQTLSIADAARSLLVQSYLRSDRAEVARQLAQDPDHLAMLVAYDPTPSAVQHAQHAIAKLPQTTDDERQRVVLLQAQIAIDSNDIAMAITLLTAAARRWPLAAAIQNISAYALMLGGNHEAVSLAGFQSSRAMRLSPGEPAIMDTRGLVLMAQGDGRQAVRWLDLAHRMAPGDAEIMLHLAQAFEADHAPKTAATLLEAAAQLPALPRVRAQITAAMRR